ncbi:hypothetical protein JMF94_03470 [Desulfovibrio sp. UIB00]|uniref:hypothetical protein n=1 Tax=Desulfovibrio sp. UIB00 TaxID=2804314 RepID=UPI001F0E2012|nr:hypothetical protein [Desulfovibrio sp. UIB00]MCH5144138.1 hypothetical protein [Desulfovibrio sp. UIB00]
MKKNKRQRKRENLSRKPREEWIYATTVGETTSLEISVNPKTGATSFGQPMENAYAEISHTRDGKTDKVIQRVYQNPDMINFETDNILFNRDKLLFIDTNQKDFFGIYFSVTAVTIFRENNIFLLAFIVRAAKEKFEERKFWYYALRCLVSHGLITLHEKINIYVDSHLGIIAKINSRSEPMCENIFLPQNMMLHYATADKGTEYNANRAFKLTDKMATEALNNLAPKLPQMISNAPLQEHVYFFENWGSEPQSIPLCMLYSPPPWE